VDFLDLREIPGVSVPEPGPRIFALALPVPNPARAGAEIRFSLAAPGSASLAVYDVSGRRVRTLVTGEAPAGPQRVRWDATDERGDRVAAGVYYLRLAAAGKALVRSVVIAE
jgi:hypothetical protein